MTLQRIFSCITGVFFAVGFAASQAGAGPGPGECGTLEIEVNALRGGSPTVSLNTTKNITAKARIAKGTAVEGTVIDTTLKIEAFDGDDLFAFHASEVGPIRLGVGKNGKGAKIGIPISRCTSQGELPGFVEFVATFTEIVTPPVIPCVGRRSITKTCK